MENKMKKISRNPMIPKCRSNKEVHNIVILALNKTFISFFLIAMVFGLGFTVDSMYTIRQDDAPTLFQTQDKYSHSQSIESTSAISEIIHKHQTMDSQDDTPIISAEVSTHLPVSTQTSSNYDDLCTVNSVSRRTLIKPYSELAERTLTCSRVNDKNYRHMVKSIYRRNKLNLQQIEITQSEPSVVFSAIDLICDPFNCSKLTVFNMTGQRIHELLVLSQYISSWPHLEILDLSNTSLNTIEFILEPKSIILDSLTTLLLDNNNITEINFDYILKRFPNLLHLSLTNNAIFNVSCSENIRPRVKSQLETISLAGNSINCEKNHFWFIEQISNVKLRFPDHEKINCSVPERLADMTWSQRVSVLETTTCDRCECRSLKRTAISVDCHNKNWTHLPDVLPINTKILNLTSNRINTLELPPDSKNWENVTYVYLENNLISSFQPLETNSKFMRNLAALDIRKNKFQEFPSHIFEQFTNLDQVHLSNNPWLCDCEPTFAFQEWLQRQFHKVGDKEDIMCGISGSDENGVKSHRLRQRLSSKVIYRLSKSELCPQINSEEPYDWLDIVNLALGLTIILVITKVGLDYTYQHRTKRLPHFFRLNY